MYTNEVFPYRLKQGREYRGLSQKELAETLGIETASYGRYELGKANINASELPKIANLEQLDIRFYFDESMDIESADLNLKKEESAIKLLAMKFEELSEKIDPKHIENEDNEFMSEIMRHVRKLSDNELIELNNYILFIESRRNSDLGNSQKKRNVS